MKINLRIYTYIRKLQNAYNRNEKQKLGAQGYLRGEREAAFVFLIIFFFSWNMNTGVFIMFHHVFLNFDREK